jgi:hypothetical protein
VGTIGDETRQNAAERMTSTAQDVAFDRDLIVRFKSGDQSAFVYAFSFEFTVQTFNQLTGVFGSWMIHILHNAAVVTKSLGFLLA